MTFMKNCECESSGSYGTDSPEISFSYGKLDRAPEAKEEMDPVEICTVSRVKAPVCRWCNTPWKHIG